MGVRSTSLWVGVLALAMVGTAVGQQPKEQPTPPAKDGQEWPRTALQPGRLPPPSPNRPNDPFVEPPISPFLPGTALPQPTPGSGTDLVIPGGGQVNLPGGTRQLIRFGPRYERLPNYVINELPDDVTRLLYTGGAIVNVIYPGEGGAGMQEIEFAADTVVAWVKGVKGQNIAGGFEVDSGDKKEEKEIELYLAGDVVIRSLNPAGGPNGEPMEQVLRAPEIYYNVTRNRAIAMDADLEMKGIGVPDSVHIRGQEVWRLGRNEWQAFNTLTYSSKRPNDPNLTVEAAQSRLLQQRAVRTNIFGRPYRGPGGEQEIGFQRTLINEQASARLFGLPFFYSPRTETDLSEPFGPLAGIGLGNDQIFGFQVYTSWDVYKLLAQRPRVGHRWVLDVDYLAERGLGLGTMYNYAGQDFFGLEGPNVGFLRLYGISDSAPEDILGGSRGPQPPKPDYRGRAHWRHSQDLYESSTTWLRHMAQVQYLSDKNFLEQYYKIEFDIGPNQETFWYLHGATDNFWGSSWLEANMDRRWVTEAEWLPRFDGAMIGESLLNDWFIYSARGSAGYARLLPSIEDPLPVLVTDDQVSTGRLNLNQRLSAPFDLGPLRLDPYGVLDLTQYTEDLTGESRGRFYGAGGLTASLSGSRVYREASSEIFNVRGLNHKVTLEGNYHASRSDTNYERLPQLDRMFDDALDQGYRNIRPIQTQFVPGPAGILLQDSALYDPQQYAIRRLVENSVDTLDGLQVIQAAVRQRLQTKRGFPGSEHVVDWMSLDLSASYFPDPARDNYGQSWSFLEYYYLWHMGDRFSFTSAGWYDPLENGPGYYNVGINYNRPDGTNVFLSYRHTDPIRSRALTAVINYQLSQKYSMNIAGAYDFGINEAITNSVSFARVGTDTTVLFGFTYNALVNNFGLQFAIVPNATGFTPGAMFANTMMTRR